MNCVDCKQYFDDYIDGYLDFPVRVDMERHLVECADCAQGFEKAISFRQSLRKIPIEPMSPGFIDAMLHHAVVANTSSNISDRDSLKPATIHAFEPSRMKSITQKTERLGVSSTRKRSTIWFATGFGGALAAGLTFFLIQFGIVQPFPTKGDAVQYVTMTVNENKSINLVFNSPETFQDATFQLDMTDGLVLVNESISRQMEWKSPLNSGKNLMPITLKANRSGKETMIIKIRQDNQDKEFRIHFEVKPGQLGTEMRDQHRNWL